jgi:hypothetical protein
LDKALAAARLHRASLVVSKVDRLTRSVAFLSRLLEAGVDVRFADLPQIEGATGRFMYYLHMLAFEAIGDLLECPGLLVLDRALDKLFGELVDLLALLLVVLFVLMISSTMVAFSPLRIRPV